MKKELTKTEKLIRLFRVIGIALAAVLVVVLLGIFALLIKVKGNVSYIYNYLYGTRGSLPVTEYAGATVGADAKVPYCIPETDPLAIFDRTEVSVNGVMTDAFARETEIEFSEDYLKDFTAYKGIITFRGNYMRSLSAYGTPQITENKIAPTTWKYKTGKFLKCDGVNYWSGNGWTGQPLAVQWDPETRNLMNLYKEAKSKANLVEVIYPGMDGKIRFLDMETGKETREPINVGMTFKGTCSLHPDYPLLICGSGDSATGLFGEQVSARLFIYNLIDGTKLGEIGANDALAPRVWHAFDSSPIFCTAADTVICPGENGLIYTVRLNTEYNPETGELRINPDETVRYAYYPKQKDDRFGANGSSKSGAESNGSESSAVVYDKYLFFGDNGGIFQCLDLNTMQPVWVQDLYEDINSSPVFEINDNGEKFIYVATTLKFHYDANHLGEACLYKLNAMTGAIVWKKPYEVHTVQGLAGGFLSSGACGSGDVSDYLFYSVSKVPSVDTGYIVAISKTTGEEYWRLELRCDAWSSGCLIKAADGKTRLVQCCANGDILLIDAKNGKILDTMNFGSNIESTPVIFENRLAVGLRSENIIGIEFK